MNQTTTMNAMLTTLHSTPTSTQAKQPRSLLARWLAAAKRAHTIENEHRTLLDLAVDHSDLEWRVLELNRRPASFSVGGARF
jgi:hypothetical protein